jgi:hypothetical protein
MPVNQVYLQHVSVAHDASKAAYMLEQILESTFRRGDQFSGSLGSFEGVGTSTISPAPASAWRVRIVWSKSTKCTVPGIDSGVISVVRVMVSLESKARLQG